MSEPGNHIPKEVQRFLFQHISSTEQLEVLLMLSRHPSQVWTAAGVYACLKTNMESISRHLQEFRRRGLLVLEKEDPPAYRFKTGDANCLQILDQLRVIYRTEMHRVIDVIYSKPSAAAQSFADAFRLRKD